MKELVDNRRQSIREAAMPVGSLASFAVAAVSVPGQGRLVGGVVLSMLVVIVVAVSVLAGRTGGVTAAFMAAFSFDFFHVAPIRILHPRSLGGLAVILVTLALLAGGSRRAPRV